MTPSDKANDSDPVLLQAQQLYAGARYAMLATHSRELPDYPFGSVAPCCLDHQGFPLFLLSHLAEHSKNLAADPRCSLTFLQPADGDVQQRARLTAVGEMEPCDEGDAERFFRCFPQTRFYFEQLNFRFHRFRPQRLHFNGGFATARWYGPSRIVPSWLPTDAQVSKLLEWLNREEQAALELLAGGPAEAVAVDPLGLDLHCGDKGLLRIDFIDAVGSDELLEAQLRTLLHPPVA